MIGAQRSESVRERKESRREEEIGERRRGTQSE